VRRESKRKRNCGKMMEGKEEKRQELIKKETRKEKM
jgi:hypothetical protein